MDPVDLQAPEKGERGVPSRRDLRTPPRQSKPWRVGGALAVALGLVAGTYTFASTAAWEHPDAPVDAAHTPLLPRHSQVSRSVDRLPLEGAEQRTFTATIDGEQVEITTRARTLAQALAEEGIEIGFHDEVSEPMHGEPVDVTITRVVEAIETVEEKIPFTTTRTPTDSLTKGTERVQTKGKDGVRTATKRVLRKDGKIIAEEILAQATGSEPVNEVILVGTKPAPAPAPARGNGETVAAAPTPHSGGSPRAIAQNMLGSFGWGQDQWSCLNSLWQRESNWNHRALNTSSGAYGIPQSLPGSKMASAGADWQTNPATQIKWGLGYIQGRYGSPCGAWAHSQATGWY